MVGGGVRCGARLGGGFLRVPGGLRPASVLQAFLLVLLQRSTDGVLHQPPADPQELRLVGFGAAAPTWKKHSILMRTLAMTFRTLTMTLMANNCRKQGDGGGVFQSIQGLDSSVCQMEAKTAKTPT